MRKIDSYLIPLGLFLVSIFYVPWLWYPYNGGKWSLIHVLASVAAIRWITMGIPVPKWKKWEWGLFASIFFISIGQAVYKSNLFVFSDRLSFFMMLFYANACFSLKKISWKNFYWSFLASVVIVVLIGLYQILETWQFVELQQTKIGSTFGFSNNAGQSLIIMLVLLAWLSDTKKKKYIFGITLIFSIVYLFFLQTRSLYIGVLAGGFVASLGYLYQIKRKRALLGLLTVSITAVISVFLFRAKIDDALTNHLPFTKGSMISWRKDIWSRSLPMIKDFPFGTGPFRYEFTYMPYLKGGIAISELNSPDNPHNEFLRYAIEDGIVFSPIYFLALVIIFVGSASYLSVPLLMLIGLYLSEMFFQFIWMCPYPFVVGTILIGYCLSKREIQEIEFLLEKKTMRYALQTTLGIVFFLSILARFTETSNHLGFVSISCGLVPLHWRACLQKARIEVKRGDLNAARHTVLNVLELDPWNFAAIRHMANIAFLQKRSIEGCFYLWKHEDLFGFKSSLTDDYVRNCSERVRNYLEKHRPEKYVR